MRRRSRGSIVASPVLVGAVTVLVVVVAVFLAYNANNGLPFVPTRTLKVEVSNGAELVKGNEVRSGGHRVGVVADMQPHRLPGGKVGALVELQLDQKLGAIPVDSQVTIRPRSALGLKYVQLDTGRSRRTIPDGGTLPAAQAHLPVELDEVYDMFDAPTRRASRDNLVAFGDAFAGRGVDLNQFIQTAPALFGVLRPVMANLAAPSTDLDRFFRELGDAARIVAPVSKVDARLFTHMATTFEALSRDPKALEDAIAKGPDTLAVGTRSLAVQRPFLDDTAAFSHDVRFAVDELHAALPDLNGALQVGTPVTRRSVALDDDLEGAMDALDTLSRAPATSEALTGLTATVTTLQPQLRFLGPYVTVCNYWNMFWTFTAEHFTAPDQTGSSERAMLNNGAPQDDDVTTMGANEFAHGQNVKPINGGAPQYVHNNTAGGFAITPDGAANCQKGQQGYLYSANPFTDDPKHYGRVSVDQPRPDGTVVGPTYATFDRQGHGHGLNPAAVPPGETFTQTPGGIGAQLP